MGPKNRIYCFIFILLVLILSCENAEKIDENITSADLSGLQIPQNTQALVTFLSGNVDVSVNGEWEALFIGDFIETGNKIKVYDSSFCELQFGDTAVVKIQENTEIVMDSVFFETKQTDIVLNIIAGSLLCKVDKLVGNDSFNVKTNSSVCGVRGTEFMVKEDQSGTILAVKEGKVAVLPVDIDVDSLLSKVEAEKISELKKLLQTNISNEMGFPTYNPTREELVECYEEAGLRVLEVVGAPVFMHLISKEISEKLELDPEIRRELLKIELENCTNKSLVNFGGHLQIIGKKE